MSHANQFLRQTGAEVAELLGDGFKFFRSKRELRRTVPEGRDVIILSGSTKWSPLISVSFYYGKNYHAIRNLEKQTNDEPMPYHVQQYSPNIGSIPNLIYEGPGTWEVDISDPPPGLANEIAAAVRGVAYPFFKRFTHMETARDAMAVDDPWCFTAIGHGWHAMLKMDAALDDFAHFESWRVCQHDFYDEQIRIKLHEYKNALA